jgi:hypothetical protein
MAEEQAQRLETVAAEVMRLFHVKAPPVPLESMLQQPPGDLWERVDLSQLTGNFWSIKDPYSPRMSLARLLARHIISSSWGEEQQLRDLIESEQDVRAFARMLIMPFGMIQVMSAGARTAVGMSINFEVPEEDAQKRLIEVAGY